MHSVESWRMFTLNINYFLPVTFVPLGRCCRASWLKELFLSQEHRNFDEYFLNAANLCIGLEMYIADLLETWHCLLIKTGLLRFIFYFILFLSFMYIWSWKQEFFFFLFIVKKLIHVWKQRENQNELRPSFNSFQLLGTFVSYTLAQYVTD